MKGGTVATTLGAPLLTMSRAFLESFFPAATSLARVVAPARYDAALPAWAAAACPSPSTEVAGMTLRMPALIVPGVAGILIGFLLGRACVQ